MNKELTLKADLRFQNNTTSKFTCYIDDHIILSGSYEVALTDIIYTNDYKIKIGLIGVEYSSYMIFDNFNEEIKNYTQKDEEEYLKKKCKELYTLQDLYRKEFVNYLEEYFDMKNSTKNEYVTKLNQIYRACDSYHEQLKQIEIINLKHGLYYNYCEFKNLFDIPANILKDFKVRLNNIKESRSNEYNNIIQCFLKLIETSNWFKKINENKSKQYILFEIYDRLDSSQIIYEFYKKFHNFFYINNTTFTLKPYIKHIHIDPNFDILFNHHNNFKSYTLKNKGLCQLIKYFKIYTDIIDDSLIFCKNEKVLKIIKPEGIKNDVVEKSYDRPQYIAVNKTYISKINIHIKDQDNNFINFDTTPIIKLNLKFIKK